jgi:hypothetical protein
MLTLLFRCEFKQLFQSLYFFIKIDQWIIKVVGCSLARNFAKTIYDNMPALRTAQITGRGGEVEINENGTKTIEWWRPNSFSRTSRKTSRVSDKRS